MHKLLEQLVGEMVDRNIDFQFAQREFEKVFISRVLQRCDGNVGKAAGRLGVHRNTLTRKLHDLKIKSPR